MMMMMMMTTMMIMMMIMMVMMMMMMMVVVVVLMMTMTMITKPYDLTTLTSSHAIFILHNENLTTTEFDCSPV